jgi:hypothetical protein
MLKLILRLLALGCLLIAPLLYLLVAHHAHLVCDRAAATCVLEETRPLRAVQVQIVQLPDVLDAGCQADEWHVSPKAPEILKNGRRPFNAGNAGVWETIGGGNEVPKYRVVLLTKTGIIPVTPSFVRDCANRDAIIDVLDGRSAHGELDLGRWQETLTVTVLPVGLGVALFLWSGSAGKRRADGASSATT